MGFRDRDYYKPSGFGGFSFFPPVIKNLLIINGIVFFIQMIFDNLIFGQYSGGYLINRYFALNPIAPGYNFQIWQLITYQFLHGGFMHIFFNMFALWMFGMEIESLMGSQKFLIFYLGTGVVGGLVQLFVGPLVGGVAPTIGASGSVFGVLVAFAMYFPDRYIFLLIPPIPIKAKYLIVGYMVIEFMSVSSGSFVAHLVHLGGGLSGVAFILWDRKKNINFERMYNNMKRKVKEQKQNSPFRKPPTTGTNVDIQDADFYEINNSRKEEEITQAEIDRILDKISQSGYQNLTEKEKRILFEVSKRK